MADPIIVTDPSGATVLMNAPAEELFTVPPDADADGAAHRAGQRRALLVVHLRPAARRDRARRDPARRDRPDEPDRRGEPIPVEAIAGKVLTETGELTAVVTILHDRREALERARLYEQLKLASDELQMRVQAATAELATQNELLRRQAIELEQASRLKSQFLANMSHEFRTPLNAILGYTHMLLQGVAGDLPPTVKRQLQRIDSNGRHLLTIINEILDITRIEAGKMPMQISEFNLNELVPEVMAELDPVIARSKLTVTPRLSPELPPMRQRSAEGEADRRQPAEQRAEVHAPGRHRDRASSSTRRRAIGVDRGERHRHRHRAGAPRDGSSRTSARWTTRRRGSTAAPGSAWRSAAGWRRARRPHHAAEQRSAQGSTFTLTIPVEAPQ